MKLGELKILENERVSWTYIEKVKGGVTHHCSKGFDQSVLG